MSNTKVGGRGGVMRKEVSFLSLLTLVLALVVTSCPHITFGHRICCFSFLEYFRIKVTVRHSKAKLTEDSAPE